MEKAKRMESLENPLVMNNSTMRPDLGEEAVLKGPELGGEGVLKGLNIGEIVEEYISEMGDRGYTTWFITMAVICGVSLIVLMACCIYLCFKLRR